MSNKMFYMVNNIGSALKSISNGTIPAGAFIFDKDTGDLCIYDGIKINKYSCNSKIYPLTYNDNTKINIDMLI